MGLYLGGLIIGRIFVSAIWGAYFREGLFLDGGGGEGRGAYHRNFTVFYFRCQCLSFPLVFVNIFSDED